MKHFKFKTLLATLIFITMSSLIIANGTFIVLTNNMVSLTGENGDISIIVNDGQGKTYEMMGDIGDDISLPFSLSSTDTHFEGLEVKTTLSYNNKTVTNTEYLFNSSNSYYIEDPLNGNKITKIEITKVEKNYSSYTMSDYINDNSAPVIKLNYNSSPTSQNSGTAIFDPGINGSGEAINTYVPLSVTNISNKSVKFVFNDGTNYSDETTFTNNPSSASASHAYSAVTAANNLITIVLQNDLTLGSNAKLVLEAQNGTSGSGLSGHVISGKYTALDLNGHTITMEDGSTIYGHGLIYDSTGEGQIIVKNNASIYSGFLVEDFGGGGHTVGSYTSKSVPFSLYSMPYINTTIKFEYGGKLYGLTELFAYSAYNRTIMNVIGTDNTFLLSNTRNSSDSYIIRSVEGMHTIDSTKTDYRKYLPYVNYDEIYTANNAEIQLNSLKMNLEFSVSDRLPSIGVTLDMVGVHFPIPPWINLNLTHNSSFTWTQRVDMFPGSKVYCDTSSSVHFSDNAGLMTLNNFLYPVYYTINPYGSNSLYAEWNKITDLPDVTIDGTLTVSGNNNTLGGNINLTNNSNFNNNLSEFSKLNDDWSCYFRGSSSMDNVDIAQLIRDFIFGGLNKEALTKAILDNLNDGALSSIFIYPKSYNNIIQSSQSSSFNYYDNTYTDSNGNTYFYFWPNNGNTTPRITPSGSYQTADDVFSQTIKVQTTTDYQTGEPVYENMTLNLAVKKNNRWYINFAGSFIEALPLNLSYTAEASIKYGYWDEKPLAPTDNSLWTNNISIAYLENSSFEYGIYGNNVNINADASRYNSTFKDTSSTIDNYLNNVIVKASDKSLYNSTDSIIELPNKSKDPSWTSDGTVVYEKTSSATPINAGYGQFYFDTTMCLWRWRK